MIVKFPKSKIIKIDSLRDNEFMQKYNHSNGTNNMKYYLIITYKTDNEEKEIIFWGTAKEAIQFNKLKEQYNENIENYIL